MKRIPILCLLVFFSCSSPVLAAKHHKKHHHRSSEVIYRVGKLHRIADPEPASPANVVPVGAAPKTPPPANPYVAPTPSTTSVNAHDYADAEAWWETMGTTYLATFNNGQCTALAATRRPGIVQVVSLVADARAIEAGEQDPADAVWGTHWYAYEWDMLAAEAGLSVGSTPAVGALMVFHSGIPGHIAYVTAVGPEGEVTIEEMHAPELAVIDTRVLSATQIATEDDIDFVY